MIYSYTQISQYIACPRRYRYRYLNGWEEAAERAATVFGRVFEQAIAAYFRGEDCQGKLFDGWSEHREAKLEYGARDSWDKMYQQGLNLLALFAQQDRVRIADPYGQQQLRIARRIGSGNEFVGYVDAIGELNGSRCVLDWKTTSACYAIFPAGLTRLDAQLISYSWLTGIADVALVVFVRKRLPEIQYLKATITEQQRADYGALVEACAARIEAGEFPTHSGIRFPQSSCVSCPYVGLCLDDPELARRDLVRRRAGLDWLDELAA